MEATTVFLKERQDAAFAEEEYRRARTEFSQLLRKWTAAQKEWKEKQEFANIYIGQALDFYFSHLGVDPFQEETE